MAELSEKELVAWEKTRDLNAELSQAVQEIKHDKLAHKTEFTMQEDGSVRRVITRRNGIIEKVEIIPAERTQVAAERAATGLSKPPLLNSLEFQCEHFRNGSRGGKHLPAPPQPC